MNLGPEHIVSIILASISLIGVCFTAWCTATVNSVKRDTKEINKAVNHAPPNGARLYDAVLYHGEALLEMSGQLARMEEKLDTLPCTLHKCPVEKNQK